MNEPESIEPTTHQQATLLPWYLTNSLDREEKLEVEMHLNSCETCQKEFEEMKRTQVAVKAAVSEREGPSPAVLTQVMARIREEKASTQRTTVAVSPDTPGIWAQIEAWFQSLFAVPWVPVIATILIVGQSALLFTNLGGKLGPLDQGPVTVRGIPQAPSLSKSSQLEVVFEKTATLREIQSLLQQIQAQIISGPSSDGSYILEISTKDLDQIQTTLQTLNAQSDIIHSAKSAAP